MEFDSIINLAYVIAATLFVFGIKMLGSAETARRGNMISGIIERIAGNEIDRTSNTAVNHISRRVFEHFDASE